jgi:DNA-binding transcriptional MerR regulator
VTRGSSTTDDAEKGRESMNATSARSDAGPPEPQGAGARAWENRDAAGLAPAAVARRLGVAPATLRTWDRRYGLGPSSHVAGEHRRYTVEDVGRLLLMRELTLDGVGPADAARLAAEAPADEAVARAHGEESPEQQVAETVAGRPTLRAIDGGRTADDESGSGRADEAVDAPARIPLLGGTLHRLEAGALVTEIVDAAIAYDEPRCDELLRIADGVDPASWWVDVVEPARQRLLARVVLAGPGEAPDVLLNNATLHALREFQRNHAPDGGAGGAPVAHPSRLGRIVLIFSAIGEPLPVVAHALAASLVAHGVTARVVTGPAGAHRSIELVTMVQPIAIVTVSGLAQPPWELVEALHEAYPELSLFVGLGQGQDDAQAPLAREVHRVRSFTGLLHEVLAVAPPE